jgi:enamine deaminase RidA (YjgF/YER057c/UK114 family)
MVKRTGTTKIMHRVVEANGMLYLGGIAADDINTGMEEQTRQICGKIEKLLVEAGSDKTKVVAATIYITDMPAKDAMNKAWTEWLPAEHLPARATIGVATLGDPRMVIEVVVTAAL